MARLKPSPRAAEKAAEKTRIPHLSLDQFARPAPDGWTGRQFTVDQLPDDPPAVPGQIKE